MTTPQSFGKYTVTRILGRGGMAEVYEAYNPILDRRVAIKVIFPQLSAEKDFEERFRREAKLIAALRHPHIVQLYDYDIVEDQPFMIMEYLEGGTLRERLDALRARGEVMPLVEVARLITAVAEALDYAHTQGAVHRDIKPANIMFTAQNEPVLTDFGIAKVVIDSVQISLSGNVIGTPAYMSPEQARSMPVDARSDTYSLGVVAYELVAGRVPFDAGSPTAVMLQHISEPPPSIMQFNPNVSEQIEAVILTALAKQPEQRYAHAGDLARAFSAALQGRTVEAPGTLATVPSPLAAPTDDRKPSVSQIAPVAAPNRPSQPDRAAARASSRLPIVTRFAALLSDRRLRVSLILLALCLIMAALQLSDLDQQLPATLAVYVPGVVVLLLMISAVVSLLGLVRASSSTRKYSAAMLIIIACCGLAWGAWLTSRPPVTPRNFVILVGDFDGAQATRRVDFARRIVDQLQTDVGTAGGTVQIVAAHETYLDAQAARAHGAASRATLVIWGWYDDLGVSPHIEVVEPQSPMSEARMLPLVSETAYAASASGLSGPRPPTLRDLSRFVIAPAAIPNFDLFVKDGPQQVSYITSAILGFAFYLQGDMARALHMLDRALAIAPAAGSMPAGLEVVHFQRANVLYQQQRIAEAVADLEQATRIKPDLVEAHHNLAIAYSQTCSPTLSLERAVAEAQTAAQLKPDNANAQNLLGELYRRTGQNEQAFAAFKAGLQAAPDSAETYESLASTYTALGQSDEAASAWQAAISLREKAAQAALSSKRSDDAFQAHLTLGYAYLGAGDNERALAEFQAAQNLTPSDPQTLQALGNVYYSNNQLDRAQSEFEAWVKAQPQNANAHLSLGLLYSDQKKTAEALAAVQRAAELSACDPSVHLVLAGLYWEQKDYQNAAREYQAVLQNDPRNADALYLLGTMHLIEAEDGQTSLLTEAVQSLRAALALRSDWAEAHFALGQAYFDQGAYEQAAGEWTAALKTKPDAATYISLGDANEKLRRWSEAAAAYQKALALRDDADTHVYLGLVELQLQKIDTAVAEYQKALELDPKSALAYMALGDAYAQQGKLDEAVTAYRRTLSLQDTAGAHAQLAGVYARQGQLDAAKAEYQKAVTLDSKDWASWLQLGNLDSRQGQLDEAEKAYRIVLNLKPDSAAAHVGLGQIAYKGCDLVTMEQELKTARAVISATQPGLISLYQGALGDVYAAQGRSDESRQIYAGLLAQPSGDVLAHLLGGEYLLRLGQLDDAARELQAIVAQTNLSPLVTSLAYSDLGQVDYERNNLAAARNEFGAALSAFPSNAIAQIGLGNVALRQNDANTALAAYQAALGLLPEYAQQVSAENAVLLPVRIQIGLGLALKHQGKTTEAAAAFDEAHRLAQSLMRQTPQWPSAHFMLALAYSAQGQKSLSDSEYATALQCDQSLMAARTRAEADLARLR